MATQEPEYLSAAELARRLGTSRANVDSARKSKRLKCAAVIAGRPVYTMEAGLAWRATVDERHALLTRHEEAK